MRTLFTIAAVTFIIWQLATIRQIQQDPIGYGFQQMFNHPAFRECTPAQMRRGESTACNPHLNELTAKRQAEREAERAERARWGR